MNFNINQNPKKRIFVAENFYEDPLAVREFALTQNFEGDIRYFKGKRTDQQIIFPGTKEAFEAILGQKIEGWAERHAMCGRFQSCTAEDSLVYHTDLQQWAGMIYLTPDAPFSCGTAMYAHKETRSRSFEDPGAESAFNGGFYDGTKFEEVDVIGNVFNRLVIFDAKCFHAAHQYFGTSVENSRLFHMFFFD
jgi:hypothetical protein